MFVYSLLFWGTFGRFSLIYVQKVTLYIEGLMFFKST